MTFSLNKQPLFKISKLSITYMLILFVDMSFFFFFKMHQICLLLRGLFKIGLNCTKFSFFSRFDLTRGCVSYVVGLLCMAVWFTWLPGKLFPCTMSSFPIDIEMSLYVLRVETCTSRWLGCQTSTYILHIPCENYWVVHLPNCINWASIIVFYGKVPLYLKCLALIQWYSLNI